MTIRFMSPQALVFVFATTLGSPAIANPAIQNQFKAVCKLKPDMAVVKVQCKSCHTTAPKLNGFGSDMKAEMGRQKSKGFTAAVWAKLGAKDSNKNGVPNKKEVTAGKLP